jgi:chromosome segregation ATPase
LIGNKNLEIEELKKEIENKQNSNNRLKNLLKEYEKKRNESYETETNILKKQIEKLTDNLELIEEKYKNKLVNKFLTKGKRDMIIEKIDGKLQEYELILKTNGLLPEDKEEA